MTRSIIRVAALALTLPLIGCGPAEGEQVDSLESRTFKRIEVDGVPCIYHRDGYKAALSCDWGNARSSEREEWYDYARPAEEIGK